LQAAPIENGEVTTRVADQLAPPQQSGGLINACATHTQHGGNKFLRNIELIGARAVSGHQQPAGKPGGHIMEVGANGGL
jgi:hypothetical protein